MVPANVENGVHDDEVQKVGANEENGVHDDEDDEVQMVPAKIKTKYMMTTTKTKYMPHRKKRTSRVEHVVVCNQEEEEARRKEAGCLFSIGFDYGEKEEKEQEK